MAIGSLGENKTREAKAWKTSAFANGLLVRRCTALQFVWVRADLHRKTATSSVPCMKRVFDEQQRRPALERAEIQLRPVRDDLGPGRRLHGTGVEEYGIGTVE